MHEPFYSDKLYPFMDKVLALIQQTDTLFYLTGGTALSRHYLRHRYSDDLDFFVNQATNFRDQVKKVIEALRRNGVIFETGTAAENFVRIQADEAQLRLKIDFVNDVPFHYGNFQKSPFYDRIDHWRNILSNKLCAVSRREPKDIADILFIARNFPFAWPEIFNEAHQKDLWVEPLEISKIIHEFPVDLLENVKWVEPIDVDDCAASLKMLYLDIFHGRRNSLSQ